MRAAQYVAEAHALGKNGLRAHWVEIERALIRASLSSLRLLLDLVEQDRAAHVPAVAEVL
jgi:hypothetical protein